MNVQANPRPASGPLVGVRVLDFGSYIAGPYGAAVLGDLGADVIKIESVGGDLARHWGPFLRGESRLFQGYNRNKRSVAVDLRAPAGRDVAHALARTADVVIENMRPGITARLGVDWPTLRALNPRLIYVSSTAFGSRGPYRDRPGFDPLLQSMSGAAMRQCATVRRAAAHLLGGGVGLPGRNVGGAGGERGALSPREHRRGPAHRDLAAAGGDVGAVELVHPAARVRGGGRRRHLPVPRVRDRGRPGLPRHRQRQVLGAAVRGARPPRPRHRSALRQERRARVARRRARRDSRAVVEDAINQPLGRPAGRRRRARAPRCRTARRSSTIRRSRRWAWRR